MVSSFCWAMYLVRGGFHQAYKARQARGACKQSHFVGLVSSGQDPQAVHCFLYDRHVNLHRDHTVNRKTLSGGREKEKGGEMLYSLVATDHHNLTVTKWCTELLSIMSPNNICLLKFELEWVQAAVSRQWLSRSPS